MDAVRPEFGVGRRTKTRVLGALIALVAVLALSGGTSSKADAAWYGAVDFCNASSSHGGNVWLYPGQRCIEMHSIRAELMALTNAPEKYGNPPGAVINGCIVGKQWSGGTGGNVYPVACANVFPGEVVWGPWQNPNLANSSWPTIINNSPWNVTAWMHGTWWGLWP